MKKYILCSAILLLLYGNVGCSVSTMDSISKDIEDQVTALQDEDNEYIQKVKTGYRDNNPDITFGNAFEQFFATPTWKYFFAETGENVVEFTGDCTYHDVAVKARLQFVLPDNADTFDIGALSFNEVPQEDSMTTALLTTVFDAYEYDKNLTGKTADTIQKELTPAPEETASILTKEEAEDLLVEWMSDHPFPVSVLYMAEPDSELNGDDYYVFGFYEELPDNVNRYTDIYISKKNAEIFSSEFYNKTLEPLNDWYTAFISKLQEDIDKKNAMDVGEIIELSNDELTELNIFLSNFLEAYLWNYSEEFTSDSELIQFAFLHNLINNPSRLKVEELQDSPYGYYEAIDGSHIVNTIDRFFDREVSLFSFDSYIYKDGKLYSPAADGGFFGYFAQVSEVTDINNGTYEVSFDFYETEYFYQGEKAFYEPESTWDDETRTHASPNGMTGYALVKKVTINDRQTYQLIKMSEHVKDSVGQGTSNGSGVGESVASGLDVFEDVLAEYANSAYSSCAYTLYDIDANGVEELLVRGSDSFDEETYVYTYAEGKTNMIGKFWSRNLLYLDENGNFYSEGSNGADSGVYEVQRISDDGTTLVTTETWENNDLIYTYTSKDGEQVMSESEYWQTVADRFPNSTEFVDSLNWQTLLLN